MGEHPPNIPNVVKMVKDCTIEEAHEVSPDSVTTLSLDCLNTNTAIQTCFTPRKLQTTFQDN